MDSTMPAVINFGAGFPGINAVGYRSDSDKTTGPTAIAD
jgi:hypothetical protein